MVYIQILHRLKYQAYEFKRFNLINYKSQVTSFFEGWKLFCTFPSLFLFWLVFKTSNNIT